MKDVEKIKPTGLFTNYIFKAIPLAFDESLSYYECLCGLLSYLKETVIPTVNNNADAIIEVQNLMTQLQNYVDNYFNNLDVQNEINNKLDEMVNDGTLENIISNYITNEMTRTFKTLEELKENENLHTGNFAKTLGKNLLNDGNNYDYYITNEENFNSVPLKNGLYAQKIFRKDETERTILIGDSYSVGIKATNGRGWSSYYKEYSGLENDDIYILNANGAGFSRIGDAGVNFLMLLQNNIDNIKEKTSIKKIIICGGCNDFNQTKEDIINHITQFFNYAKQQFPNAKIYVGVIGNFSEDNNNNNWRENIVEKVIPSYNTGTIINGGIYLCGSEFLNHRYQLFDEDKTHLTNYQFIGMGIYNLVNNHSFSNINYYGGFNINLPGSEKVLTLYSALFNENTILYIPNYYGNCNLDFTTSNDIDLGKISLNNFRGLNSINLQIDVPLYIKTTNNNNLHFVQSRFEFKNDYHLHLKIEYLNDTITYIAFSSKTISLPTIIC